MQTSYPDEVVNRIQPSKLQLVFPAHNYSYVETERNGCIQGVNAPPYWFS